MDVHSIVLTDDDVELFLKVLFNSSDPDAIKCIQQIQIQLERRTGQ